MAQDGISLVICCYNSQRTILRALKHIEKQQKCESIMWEAIIVNNNSTDNTEKIVNDFITLSKIDIKLTHEPEPGLINARICGYKNAKYSIISFVDDDNYIDKFWVRNVYEIMSNDKTIGACGGEGQLYTQDSSNIPSWLNEFQGIYALGKQSNIDHGYVNHLWGAGLNIRRSILDVIFTEKYQLLLVGRKGNNLMSGEDSEISYSTILLGWKLYFDSRLKYFHDIDNKRFDIEYAKRLFYGFGKSYAYLLPYLCNIKQKSKLSPLCVSKNYLIIYIYNSLKNIYFYFKLMFHKNKLSYKMKIIFNSGLNEGLFELKNDYIKLFNHVNQLQNTKLKT